MFSYGVVVGCAVTTARVIACASGEETILARRQQFDQSAVERMISVVNGLPKKPKQKRDNLGLPQAIKAARSAIRAAIARGYTLEEVVAALNSDGKFDLKLGTVKRYVYGVKAQPRRNGRAERTLPPVARRATIQGDNPGDKPKRTTAANAVDMPDQL